VSDVLRPSTTDSVTEEGEVRAAAGADERRTAARLWLGRRPLTAALVLAWRVVVVPGWQGDLPDIVEGLLTVPVDDSLGLVGLVAATVAASGLLAEAVPTVLVMWTGVLIGAVWRLVTPTVTSAGNPLEEAASTDGVLAVIHVAVGVVTAAGILLRPGPRPALRTTVMLVATSVAGVVSWKIGDWLVTESQGELTLRATGAAFVWPIITAAGLFAGALFPGLSRRLDV
jgi:hypothetical protein